MLRLVGVMAICVGAAWALQVLDFGHSSAFSTMLWVLAAATVAGAGSGLVYTSVSMRQAEAAPRLSA